MSSFENSPSLEKWFSLAESLSSETALYKDLLAVCERQKEAVIGNDVKAVAAIVEEQQSGLNALKKLKLEQDKLLSALACEDQRIPKLEEILELAPIGLKDELKRLLESRQAQATKLRTEGSLNRTLIDTQLQYTSFCLDLMTGRDSIPGTYSGSGALKDDGVPRRKIIDQSI